jgi:hypothetical protein
MIAIITGVCIGLLVAVLCIATWISEKDDTL